MFGFFFFASKLSVARAWGILSSGCPPSTRAIPGMWYLNNILRDFPQTLHIRQLKFKDELVRFWRSKVIMRDTILKQKNLKPTEGWLWSVDLDLDLWKWSEILWAQFLIEGFLTNLTHTYIWTWRWTDIF